ncbi:hypothetical protein ACQEVC_06200 [Plantactinospora sp. CA-294935]|uniref:hypothetical protein n=1 Tax=Plantactinospora sp. CA-294935 TaxID=3240012 RepID=UPI003D8EB01A
MPEHERKDGAPRSALGIAPDTCPLWCQGCLSSSPGHRSRLATVGREGSGWLSVQLVADRGAGHAPLLQIDVTRHGSTETVLLTFAQTARMIGEIIHLPHPIGAWQLRDDAAPGDESGN